MTLAVSRRAGCAGRDWLGRNRMDFWTSLLIALALLALALLIEDDK